MSRWIHRVTAPPTLAALILFAGFSLAGAQPAFLVKDINTTVTGGTLASLSPVGFVELNGVVYMNLVDGVHGAELWRTDGTAAGTWLVKDVCSGVCSGDPVGLTVVGTALFFRADDGVHGGELWKSDGTEAGTAMVADLRPGLGESNPEPLADLGGVLLFSAITPDHGRELWRSDGSAAGTWLVKEVEPGPTGSQPRAAAVIGGTLFFQAHDSVAGNELWKTDGTAAGTVLVKDINPGSPQSGFVDTPYPGFRGFAVLADRLYFAAYDPVHGSELWGSDGTESGTTLVKDIAPGISSSSPFSLIATGDEVLFRASDVASDSELWKTDGTEAGTVRVKDIGSAPGGSHPADLTLFQGDVYFAASDSAHGRELWRTDGTEAGTLLVKDIFPGPDSGLDFFRLAEFMDLGSRLLFFADDGIHGPELWQTDGTESGTTMVGDLYPGPFGSYVAALETLDIPAVLGGTGLFRAWVPGSGAELWRSDGTAEGTEQVAEVNAQASAFELIYLTGDLFSPRTMVDLDGTLLFQADDGTTGAELWRSDGSEAGTFLVENISLGSSGSYPDGMTPLGDQAIFLADETFHGSDLWRSDGTAAGTSLIEDLPPATASPSAGELTLAGDAVFFAASDGPVKRLWRTDGTASGTAVVSTGPEDPLDLAPLGTENLVFAASGTTGYELWKSDGTPAGTQSVKDIDPGPGSSHPNRMVPLGSSVLFSAHEMDTGRELWRTDGTEAGTQLVKDIRPGLEPSIGFVYPDETSPRDGQFTAAGGLVFLPADDGIVGEELWRSDGTEAGTVLIKDILPGSDSSEILWLTAVGDRVVFVAGDGVHGRELWSSDGTGAGTFVLADVQPGPGSSLPNQLATIGGWLFFSADDGVHGREPWVTDGTLVGTRLLQDVAPGAGPSSPLRFTASGPFVYFAANDNTRGFELWALPIAALGPPTPGDTMPPTVIRIETFPAGVAIGELLVTFSEPLYDPPGDGETDDVTNPANFLLVEAGPDAVLDTASCAAGVTGDDVRVPIAAVAFDAATPTATVSLEGLLPLGRYAFLVCGTTTLRDLAGNPLAGGVDHRFELVVDSVLEVPTLSPMGGLLFALLLAAGAGWVLRKRADRPG